MDKLLISKIALSLAFLLVLFFGSLFATSQARQIQQKKQLAKSRYYLMKRMISILTVVLAAGVLIMIWGISIKNLWVSMTSLLAMVAVAFFAVWSLVGNILAGIIIFFTAPFKTNDTIEILPDNVKGRVLAITTFFVLLQDEDENITSVPNSLVFQKYVKKIRKKAA